MTERQLRRDEIRALEKQGCTAQDWARVTTVGDLDTERIRQVRFSGAVRLGMFADELITDDGVPRASGIYNCLLHECSVGDNSYLRDIGTVSRYDIGEQCIIEGTRGLITNGPTSFGNGTSVSVVNEGGGRAMPICDQLSAQVAYLLAMYRHDEALIDRLSAMVSERAEQLRAMRGTVGNGAWICNSGVLTNVLVGEHARVAGAVRLEEGALTGSASDPVRVGDGVIARHFIALEGARIGGGVHIERCLVGQGVNLGKGFTANDSVFFANCEGFNGEMCSVFAGPYTVSHHKSTLLIAGLFSFFNAGSATNQSNHMYKLGPLHEGVMERGCKTGSGAYLLWPSRVGAFTAVIGRHYANFDSSDLPFSLIREEEGHSYALPGVGLLGCGLWRDEAKWKERDWRKAERLLDIVCTDVLTPVTVGAIERALGRLAALKDKAHGRREYVVWKGLRVRVRTLESYGRYYRLALDRYLGEKTAARLDSLPADAPFDSVRERFAVDMEHGMDSWVDIAGWVVPRLALEQLLGDVRGGVFASLGDLTARIARIDEGRASHEWAWCAGMLERLYGVAAGDLEQSHLAEIGRRYRKAAGELSAMIELDAAKEFGGPATLGYGIDGDDTVREQDFAAVRGHPERHQFVAWLHETAAHAQEQARKLERLAGLRDADSHHGDAPG